VEQVSDHGNRLMKVSGSLLLEPSGRPILQNPPGSLKAAGTGLGPAALDRNRRVL